MEYSAKALILARMFDELDERGQAVLFAVAKSEHSYMNSESLHRDYCSISDRSCDSQQTFPDQSHS